MSGRPEEIPEDFVCRAQAQRRAEVERTLFLHERDWRLVPGDGQDPCDVSAEALEREWRIEQQVRQLPPTAAQAERRRLKYFPVLFVSAPHIESGASGSFPGMPTPLLYATAVLDRLLRIDEFPGPRVPEIVATMNPPGYDEAFEQELTRCLETQRPVVVGISNLSEGHHFALRIARLVKTVVPEALVILGGQHEDAVNVDVYHGASDRVRTFPARRLETFDLFSLTPQQHDRLEELQTLSRGAEREYVDLVIAGDGTYALLEVLKVVADSPPADDVAQIKARLLESRNRFAALPGGGNLHLVDPRTQRVESLPLSGALIAGDELPFIDVTRLTHENRFSIFNYRNTAQILACLGCKYACEFCHESADAFLYNRPKIRQRTPAHVVKEIDLRQEQGFEAVFFDDSTFTQNPRWLFEFLDLLEKREAPVPVEWGCQTTINDVDEDMVRRMGETGCSYIYFGVESAEPEETSVQKARQLRIVAGSSDTDWATRLRQVALWCRKAGIRVGTSLQFGLGETHEQRLRTMDLVAQLHESGCIPDGCVSLNINSPYPGTRQWLKMLKAGEPLPDYRNRLVRHPAFETAHQYSRITGQDAEDLYRLALHRLGSAIHVEG